MKITNQELLTINPRLNIIAERALPVKVSYAIAKNSAKITAELKLYDSERAKLIDEYAVKDETGKVKIETNNQATIKKECIDEWNLKFLELLNIETDIEIHKFSISALDGLSMSPNDMKALECMIEE